MRQRQHPDTQAIRQLLEDGIRVAADDFPENASQRIERLTLRLRHGDGAAEVAAAFRGALQQQAGNSASLSSGSGGAAGGRKDSS